MEPPVTALSTVLTSARVFLAITFLIAGIPKLIAGKNLSTTLRVLGVERRSALRALRAGVPLVEIAVGLWLLTDIHPVAASLTGVTILTAFTFVLARLRERNFGCACFLWSDDSVELRHIFRNLVLIAIAAAMGLGTLFEWYAWEPVWQLPTQSVLVVAASALFVLLVYALITTTLHFRRSVAVDS